MPDPFKNVKIIELMELFDDDEVTTADKIDRPERALDRQAIDDFMERNPLAGGGMLVEPGFGGVRQGYAKQKNVGKKLITLNELAKYDLPVTEKSLKGIFQSKDRGMLYKKIFKDNGITIASRGPRNLIYVEAPTKKQIDGVWKDTLKQVGKKEFTVPEKLYKPFQKEVLKIFDNFSKSGTPFSTSDIYYKLVENVQDNPRIFIPKKIKGETRVPGEVIKRALGKEKSALLLDGNLQRIEKTTGNKKKLVDILLKGKSDINTLSKTLGISKKNLFAEANTLFNDIYRYTSAKVRKTGRGEKYGYLKDLDIKDYKNLLNNLRASGFERLDERSLRALITDAYAETNPKKYSAAISKLGEYSRINNQLKEAFGFAFQLDHPLSFQALKDLKNVSPENLIRVNPIPENINKIKIGLDGAYKNILREIRAGNNSPELLTQKKAIESLSTKLGVGKFKIDNTGKKVLSFGADPFLKTSLTEKMGENIFLQNRIVKNLKNIDPNLFTEALGKRSKVTKSIQELKPIESEKAKAIKNLLLKLSAQIDPDCRKASASGGRIGFKSGTDVCLTKAKNYMTEELKKGIGTEPNARTSLIKRIIVGTGNFLKQNLSPKELLKAENLIGKPALYGALAFETAYIGDSVIRKGQPLNVATAESLVGDILNLDANVARAKNLLKSNVQISPAAKQYAQNIIDYDTFQKNQLDPVQSAIAKKLPGSDKYFKMQKDLENKITQSSDAGRFDYEKAVDEIDATQMAKPAGPVRGLFKKALEVNPFLKVGTPLEGRLIKRPGTRVGPRVMQRDFKMDLSPITYENFKSDIASKEQVDDFLKATKVIPEDRELLQEFYEKQFVKPAELEQLMESPSFRGTQFAGGGIAKEAGDPSGAMLESMNPDSQGLSGLLKRGNKI